MITTLIGEDKTDSYNQLTPGENPQVSRNIYILGGYLGF